MKLTNLVVNQTAQNIMQQFGTDIEKAHQVGDEHPNGKWVWTEYAPGKFDWRVKKSEESDPRVDNYKTASEKTGERNPGRENYGWKNSAAGYDARELDSEE